jgi:hypothetical protein
MAQISLKELVLSLSKYNNVYNILDNYNTQNIKGFIFERLWDLVIKFGCCDKFPNSEFEHFDGNINNAKLNIVSSIKQYIESNLVISGNTSGKSDITLRNKITGEYILITSKYPKSNTKDKQLDYFDVQDILAVIHHNKNIIQKYKICIVVNDKQHVLNIASRSQSEYISKYFVEQNIFDVKDLNRYFIVLKHKLQSVSYNNIETLYVKQPYLQSYFHQKLVVEKTKKLVLQGHKNILWACKCRSGKTYMLSRYILNESVHFVTYNVLIITPVILTIEQFTDDLFYKYADFNGFNIYHIKNGEQLKSLNINVNLKNIIIMSKQLLDKKDVDLLRKCKFNIVAFDENHFGGTTAYAEQTLNNYCHTYTLCIYMTATYSKTIMKWNIPRDCHIQWDIEDEVWCKTGNFDRLVDKHGEQEFYSVLQELTENGEDIGDVFTSYSQYPDMHLLTTMFDQNRYDVIKSNIKDTVYGFSMETLFSLNQEQTEFLFPNEVETFLHYISGSNKIKDFPQGDKSIFNRIKNISIQKHNRTLLTNDKFTTQLWFLPYAQGLHIDKLSKCLKGKMLNDKILCQFEILSLNSKEVNSKEVKNIVTRTEKTAKENNKQGLIILVAKQCSLGVSLPLCDIVLLLNNSSSSDEIFQMMYRSMTDAKGKTCGFVVDFNPCRILNTLLDYNTNKNNFNTEEQIKYIITNNLINIDYDMFVNKETKHNDLFKKFINIWKSNPTYHLTTLLFKIENQIIELNETDQKEVNKAFIKAHNGEKVNIKFSMTDQSLSSGTQKTSYIEPSKEDKDEEQNNEDIISISKDVLPFIIPLTCLLTIKENNNDFVEMLECIKQNEELIEVFNSQTYIWWNNKNVIELVLKIVKKYINKNSNTFDIAIKFKMELKSLLDQPEQLIELVNSLLKPKKLEKRKFGEVFTPLHFIKDNMLKDLYEYVLEKYNKNIFKNKSLKWFDPAAGNGNFFIVVYEMLIDGLKEDIPDFKERKKHIIENMLYFGELNKKNCFMIKHIFNINDEYNLNIYEGDTLELDIKKVFNVDRFDIIIGNPPYNQELTKVGALPLYNKFIEKYMNECNILSFIIPSRWFAGGKGLDKFRQNMLRRIDIPFIKHYDNAMDVFGNCVDIKGGVNYFIKDSMYRGITMFNGTRMDLSAMDVIVEDKYINLIKKVDKYPKLITKYISQDHYKIQTNDSRFTNDNTQIKCYVSQQKGFIKYIPKEALVKVSDCYKVITSRAAYKASSGFGNTFIGYPQEVHSKSYISFNIDSHIEAESLLSYMKCKIPNLLLCLRKSSQDISENTCKWIPLPPLDREWTNDQVYEYFKLSNDEIKLVKNTKIVGYKDI